MKIKWRYVVPKIINVWYRFVGVSRTYHRGPEFFETQCRSVFLCCVSIYFQCQKFSFHMHMLRKTSARNLWMTYGGNVWTTLRGNHVNTRWQRDKNTAKRQAETISTTQTRASPLTFYRGKWTLKTTRAPPKLDDEKLRQNFSNLLLKSQDRTCLQ